MVSLFRSLVSTSFISLLFSVANIYVSFAFKLKHIQSKSSSTSLYYQFLNDKSDGEKRKDIGRLVKNIMFPGIYREYADTAEVKKTVKVKVVEKKSPPKNDWRNGDADFFSQDAKAGTYNMVDPKSAPVLGGGPVVLKKLPAIAKPANFVAKKPSKPPAVNNGGTKCIPNVGSYPRAAKPVILYEYESSPECRKVREACSALDISVEFRPCPGTTSGFADVMSVATGGKRSVPYMIDNNPSMYKPQMLGATEIINHLFETYGPGISSIPNNLKTSGQGLATVKKGGKGTSVQANARPDNIKMKALTLYGWEGAPYVKQVREALNDLSLAHVFISCAPGSSNRNKLSTKTGLFQVPYLIDPNTGIEMFESADIVKYLNDVYTLK